MKIAFDSQTFSIQQYGGISRYYTSLANNLLNYEQDVQIFAGLHQNNYLSELPCEIVKGRKVKKYPPKTSKIFQSINQFISQIQINSWEPDIIHETYYSKSPKHRSKNLRLTSVYDMIHEIFPNEFLKNDDTTYRKKLTIERVDHVICISESTKKDLIKIYDIDETKISVAHLGVDLSLYENKPVYLSEYNRPFLLYVGSRNGYKNFNRLLSAFYASPRLNKEFDLIAFGGNDFTSNEKSLIKQLGFDKGQIRHVYGNDEVLSSLYHQASAFIYPSLYEGFGLPPLEAMASGCPVVSSNTSSMPEVIGKAGKYFDPYNVEEMVFAIENVIFSEGTRKELISLGYENIKKYSWARCAKETLNIYKYMTGK